MKTRTRLLLLAFLPVVLTLSGCANPLPPDKMAYAGQWQGSGMWLLITQGGRVEYERTNGNAKTAVSGPIQKFEGNNFSVGVGFLSTTFVVSKPPYRDRGVWKMVVDEVELTRGDGAIQRTDWRAQTVRGWALT